MSTLDEKLEQHHQSAGPARCNTKQMADRYGVRFHSEGATVVCMGTIERWLKVGLDTYELIDLVDWRDVRKGAQDL